MKQALIEKRPWLLASIIMAAAYYALSDSAIGGLWLILLKGSAVALLAVYAVQRGAGVDARILAAVMALSALGDMLIELSLMWGGAAFFLSHLAAIALYLRNRRSSPSRSQIAAGAALFLLAPLVSWLISHDPAITVYATGLGAMAATAWCSRFSRYRVGLGALLFVFSDWIIFADIQPYEAFSSGNLLIWPLYFIGQFLIATGVTQTLRHELPAVG